MGSLNVTSESQISNQYGSNSDSVEVTQPNEKKKPVSIFSKLDDTQDHIGNRQDNKIQTRVNNKVKFNFFSFNDITMPYVKKFFNLEQIQSNILNSFKDIGYKTVAEEENSTQETVDLFVETNVDSQIDEMNKEVANTIKTIEAKVTEEKKKEQKPEPDNKEFVLEDMPQNNYPQANVPYNTQHKGSKGGSPVGFSGKSVVVNYNNAYVKTNGKEHEVGYTKDNVRVYANYNKGESNIGVAYTI